MRLSCSALVVSILVTVIPLTVQAENSPQLKSGAAELVWFNLQIEPLPGRDPARFLMAHDGKTVRRVMVDNLGIASTRIVSSEVDRGRLQAELVIGHSGLWINLGIASTRIVSSEVDRWKPPYGLVAGAGSN